MNCSTGSSGSWERLLNLVCSIITFFLTLKKLSNFAKMLSCFFLSPQYWLTLKCLQLLHRGSIIECYLGALQILAIVQTHDGTAENNVSTLANGLGCRKEMLPENSTKSCS